MHDRCRPGRGKQVRGCYATAVAMAAAAAAEQAVPSMAPHHSLALKAHRGLRGGGRGTRWLRDRWTLAPPGRRAPALGALRAKARCIWVRHPQLSAASGSGSRCGVWEPPDIAETHPQAWTHIHAPSRVARKRRTNPSPSRQPPQAPVPVACRRRQCIATLRQRRGPVTASTQQSARFTLGRRALHARQTVALPGQLPAAAACPSGIPSQPRAIPFGPGPVIHQFPRRDAVLPECRAPRRANDCKLFPSAPLAPP